MMRQAARYGALTAAAAGVGGSVYVSQDPGSRRQAHFWLRAGPIIGHYFGVRSLHKYGHHVGWNYEKAERKAEWLAMHERYAPEALQAILELRGLYIKFGQSCSVSPFVPKPFRTQFKMLQSDVPEEDFGLIEEVIKRELCEDAFGSVFADVQQKAVGAASTGQAHVAKLVTGEEVVVKVQYPDAKEVFEADMQCLRILVWLAEPKGLPAFDEFGRHLRLELNYDQERRNLQEVHEGVMQQDKYIEGVAVPRVFEHLCTDKVVVMEYLEGPKLEDAVKQQMRALGMDVDEKESMRDWVMRMSKENNNMNNASSIDENGEAVDLENREAPSKEAIGKEARQEADTNSGSSPLGQLLLRAVAALGIDPVELFMWWKEMKVYLLLDVGAILSDDSEPSDGASQGKGKGKVKGEAARTLQSKQKLRELVNMVLDVHGYEIFRMGTFNSDPHPGNLILMTDGRVGLIDYGQCKSLTPQVKHDIATLIVKVADNAPHAEVAQAFRQLGMVTKNDSDEFMGKMARLMFGKVETQMFDRQWHRELHRSDKIEVFPPELLLVHRVSLLLRGLSVALRHNVSIAEQWRPHAIKLLEELKAEELAAVGAELP